MLHGLCGVLMVDDDDGNGERRRGGEEKRGETGFIYDNRTLFRWKLRACESFVPHTEYSTKYVLAWLILGMR